MLYDLRVSWHIGKYINDNNIANAAIEFNSFYTHCAIGKDFTDPKHTTAIIVNELINNDQISKEDLTPEGLCSISQVVTASDLSVGK